MAKSVFYSFHYDRDVMRVQQVRNIWTIHGQPILEPQDWETVMSQGEQAIKNWIADKMSEVDAVVVLIGAQTSTRAWVKYEIKYAWNNHLPLVGVHIHGLADPRAGTDFKGKDPFWEMWDDKLGVMGQHLNTFDPSGASGSDGDAAQIWLTGNEEPVLLMAPGAQHRYPLTLHMGSPSSAFCSVTWTDPDDEVHVTDATVSFL